MNTKYVVVENAGYEREQDVKTFATWEQASIHVDNSYTDSELDSDSPDCLHVGIRADYADGTSEYIS